MRRPDLVGTIVTGAVGSGKSTLLEAAASRAEVQGFDVVRLHANRAISTVPLFVFSSVLDSATAVPDAERFVAIRRALRERSDRRPVLLAIDDAHELDDASAGLIGQLARELTLFVLASIRSLEPVPEPILALWSQGIATLIDVVPLDRDSASRVAAEALGGPLDPGLERDLWQRAAGNPLHVRELLHGSKAAGVLTQRAGVWVRNGELVASRALVDLVGHRIRALHPSARLALTAVVLAEPAGVGLIDAVAEPGALLALEEAGLINVRQDRRRFVATMAHPIYADVVRQTASVLTVQQLRSRLAAAVVAWGARRGDDLIQVATWRLDANDVEPALFASAAFDAVRRHDLELAARLAQTAHEAEPSSLSSRAVAMTLHLLGQHQAAVAELDARLSEPIDVVDAARARLLQGLVLARGEGDYPAAVAALEAVQSSAGERTQRRARAMLALIALLQGNVHSAVEQSTALVGAREVEPEAMTAHIGALAVSGRPRAAMAIADDYRASYGEPDARTLFPDFRWVAMIDAGDILTMETEVGEAWDGAVEGGDRHRQARIALAMGHVQVERGRNGAAMAWFERSSELSQSVGERFGIRWALCGSLLAAGHDGDPARVDSTLVALSEVDAHPAELFELYGRRGAALARVARGQTAQAGTDLLALGDSLLANGCMTHGLRALVDAARIGNARAALTIVRQHDPRPDGDLLPVCVDYIDALAGGDGRQLAEISNRLETLGYDALAATAAVCAHEVFVRLGDRRSATAQAHRVERMRTSGGVVAALAFTATAAATPLTRREREVAHLVSLGGTSKEVADACFLSVRTVDNHLARIYDKLGVRSRSELAAVLSSSVLGKSA